MTIPGDLSFAPDTLAVTGVACTVCVWVGGSGTVPSPCVTAIAVAPVAISTAVLKEEEVGVVSIVEEGRAGGSLGFFWALTSMGGEIVCEL